MRRKFLTIGLTLAIFAALPLFAKYVHEVYAAPGDLDPTFGTGGKVTTAYPLQATSNGQAVSLQADGKVVVAGYLDMSHAFPDFGLMRYNGDGTLDTSFSGDGLATADFRSNEDRANAVAVQADGKIVAVGFGSTQCCDSFQDFALVRFNPDGTLDASFGVGGKVLTNVANSGDNAYAVALQPDGKIVVAGVAQFRFALARYNPNGTLDTGFGTGGFTTTSFSGASSAYAYALTLQQDGKILAVGLAGGSENLDFALARYNPNGTLDTSFGTGGRVVTNLGATDIYQAVGVQTDGKIVAAGYSISTAGSPSDFALLRYNPDGTLDTGFGTGGSVLTDFNGTSDSARGLVLDSGGKISLAGFAMGGTSGSNGSFALARYLPDGSLDGSFGNGGKVTTAFLGNGEGVNALAADGAGKLVAVGSASTANTTRPRSAAAVARYNMDGSLDASFSADGKAIDYWRSSNVAVNDVVVQADGKLLSGGNASVGGTTGTGVSFMLARHNPDGSPDTGFGLGGIVTTTFTGTSSIGALTIQPDSKIVAVGRTTSLQQDEDVGLALARYNTDGSLDTGFGNGGRVVTPIGLGIPEGKGVVVQPDGKIVATGYTSYNYSILARYMPNGALDAGFGNGGTVIVTNRGERNNDIALQPDGKVLVVGTSADGQTFLVARYNPNGTLDLSFGSGGRVTTDLNGYDEAFALALLSDGRIVVGGQTGGFPPSDFALVRYFANGALDPSFGNGGVVITDFGGEHEVVDDLSLQADGKIVAGGEAPFKLARYNMDGSLDTGFGVGGRITTNLGLMEALTLQADGKIVAAGLAFSESDRLGALVRYQNDGVTTPTPTVTGTPPVASPSPTPCTPGWNGVPADDPGGRGGAFNDVLDIAANDIWAVGVRFPSSPYGQNTMIQHWNGTQWQIVPTPSLPWPVNSLMGLGATAPNDIWAVGNAGSTTLTMRWEGQNWSVVPSPSFGSGPNVLNGVAALSPNDAWAVGTYEQSSAQYRKLVLHWDGAGWNSVALPDPDTYSKLNAVATVSPNDVWAAGYYSNGSSIQALLMHWNGQNWSITPGPNVGAHHEINDVIAISANNVWAAGFYYSGSFKKTLTLHWDGTGWSTVPSPTNDQWDRNLFGLDALGPNDVWAVGETRDGPTAPSRTLALHWDGAAWSESLVLNGPRVFSTLNDVAAVGPNNVWAVGRSSEGDNSLALIEQYRGLCGAITPTSVPSAGPGSPTGTATLMPLSTSTAGSSPIATTTSTNTAVSPTATAMTTHTSTPSSTQTPGDATGTTTTTTTSTATIQPTDTPRITTTPTTPTISTSSTSTNTSTPTAIPTSTSTRTATLTRTATQVPTSTATACTLNFADVPGTNTFYANVRCLACRGIDTGYACGGAGEPCNPTNQRYFRPNALILRDDLAHMVAASAGFSEDPGVRRFQDVPPSNQYYAWVQRMANRNLIGGYPCGGPGEPCIAPNNLPYYRPGANATRGQIAKIVSSGAGFEDTPTGQMFEDVAPGSTFYVWVQRLTRPDRAVMGGYPCGGAGEPCTAPNNRPYFRWGNNATRGQVAKITANTFFPACQP